MKATRSHVMALDLLLLLPGLARAQSLSFDVSFTPQVRATPFTGRILVLLATPQDTDLLGLLDNFGWPRTFYALDVQELPPNQVVRIDQQSLGFPAPPNRWPPGITGVQAVLDQAPDDWRIGTAPGNGISARVAAQRTDARVRLVIDHLIPPREFPESSTVKLVEIASPRLSDFYGRPMSLRARVVLPDGYLEQPEKRFPVVYMLPGYMSDHIDPGDMQNLISRVVSASGPDALAVVLDQTTHGGFHLFADSANNGPVGTALVEELVPEIDRTFRTIADPKARLLTGLSMGGWASLWLQCAYPDLFGGVWSIAPHPVDFHSFSGVDLYAPGANLFKDDQGRTRPSGRLSDGTPVWFFNTESAMETVRGHGWPLQSVEAVFSPRGADGRPQPLWDRRTGAIDPAVAAAWQQYDIDHKLTSNWAVLGPKLAGKLHIYVGSMDNFYFDGAVGLLKQSLAALGSDAVIEILPGKDHFLLQLPSMNTRIAAEMTDRLQQAGIISVGAP